MSRRRTSSGTRVSNSASDANPVTFPPLPSATAAEDTDTNATDEDDEETASGGTLADARRIMAETEAGQESARFGVGAGVIPHDSDNLLPGDSSQFPPAMRGMLLGEMTAQNEAAAAERRSVANATTFSPLSTRGPAEETSGTEEPQEGGAVLTDRPVFVCPNCGREREYRVQYAGSTVPCQCGYEIRVPLPQEFQARGVMPGPATTTEVQAKADEANPEPVARYAPQEAQGDGNTGGGEDTE